MSIHASKVLSRVVPTVFVLISSAVEWPLAGQSTESQRVWLVGLQGVQVIVGPIADEARRGGLDSAQIVADVELRLREAGVPIRADAPALYVVVSAGKRSEDAENEFFYFHVQSSLFQSVRLTRQPATTLRAATWTLGLIGSVGPSTFASYVRDRIHDITDRFINDYLASNPKR